jgi:hypothetical protein
VQRHDRDSNGATISASLSGCTSNTRVQGTFQLSTTSSETLTWTNGTTTKLGRATTSTTEKDTDTKGTCPSGWQEWEVSGAVKSDTAGSAPVPGTYKMELCAVGAAAQNEPGSKVKIG